MKGLTIIGTDTSVGKTLVACSLLRVLVNRGWKPFPYKPVETGVSYNASDARLLLDAAGLQYLSEDTISKFRFPDPVAPVLAAKWAGVEITRESLLSLPKIAVETSNFVVVETSGGILTPITDGFSCLDLASSLGYPILLVARNGLGTVSHSSLAIREILSRGLPLLGLVLSTTFPEPSPDQPFNASLIERATGVPSMGVFPFFENPTSSDLLSFGLKIFSEEYFPFFPNELLVRPVLGK